MRIEKTGHSIRAHQHAAHASLPNPKNNGQVNHLSGTPTSIDVTSVQKLGALVANSMEIRESIVEGVKERMDSEDHRSRDIAIATARSILNL